MKKYTEEEAKKLILQKLKQIKRIVNSTEFDLDDEDYSKDYNPYRYLSMVIIDDTIMCNGSLNRHRIICTDSHGEPILDRYFDMYFFEDDE